MSEFNNKWNNMNPMNSMNMGNNMNPMNGMNMGNNMNQMNNMNPMNSMNMGMNPMNNMNMGNNINPMNNINMGNNMNQMNNMNMGMNQMNNMNMGMNQMNNMNMNNFITMNTGMNNLNDPMAVQFNMLMQQFVNLQQSMNMMNTFVMNNAQSNNNSSDRLPKGKGETYVDPFANYPGNRMNIIFQTPKGHKTAISAPLNVTVHEVLVQYIRKLGLGPAVLYDGFYFLYNGAKLSVKDEKKLVSDLSPIGNYNLNVIVLDTKNLIGA